MCALQHLISYVGRKYTSVHHIESQHGACMRGWYSRGMVYAQVVRIATVEDTESTKLFKTMIDTGSGEMRQVGEAAISCNTAHCQTQPQHRLAWQMCHARQQENSYTLRTEF